MEAERLRPTRGPATFEVGILAPACPTCPMRKFLLFLLLVSMIVVPFLSGRERSGARSLKRMVLLIIIFNLFFLLALSLIYPRVQ